MSSSQSTRTGQAVVLTAVTIAMLAFMGFAFGTMALLMTLLPMPVAMLLLWSSNDVRRADEEHPPVARAPSAAPSDGTAAMGYTRALEH
jgi:hypothetical protein